MSPFRVRHPRIFAHTALEGGVIFGVLFLLAVLTQVFAPDTTGHEMLWGVLGTGVLFSGCILGTRRAAAAEGISLQRESALVAALSGIVGLLAYFSFWGVSGSPRSLAALILLEGAVAVPSVVIAWRWVALRSRVIGGYQERLLIIGTGESARRVCRWIAENQADRYTVVGFADESRQRLGQILSMGARIQTDFGAMTEFCRGRVERIIVALDEKRGKLPVDPLMDLRLRGYEIEEAVTFIERTCGKIAVESLLPSWLIYSDGFRISPVRRVTKRMADWVLSVGLLAISFPLMIAAAILIRLDSPGPVFYRQRRVGVDGREFDVLKFRSMARDAEKKSGPTWATRNDPRVTRVGRILRKFRIDELPQLWNVLRGEMSFVGPRPERPHFVHELEGIIPYYRLRKTVRPGITGWAQVSCSYGSSVEDTVEKLKYDLYYIKNCGPLLDAWILLKTIQVVLTGQGAR